MHYYHAYIRVMGVILTVGFIDRVNGRELVAKENSAFNAGASRQAQFEDVFDGVTILDGFELKEVLGLIKFCTAECRAHTSPGLPR